VLSRTWVRQKRDKSGTKAGQKRDSLLLPPKGVALLFIVVIVMIAVLVMILIENLLSLSLDNKQDCFEEFLSPNRTGNARQPWFTA
jgi:ABC-type Fe3+ transport system permease subunit